jgi:hypothetical protein
MDCWGEGTNSPPPAAPILHSPPAAAEKSSHWGRGAIAKGRRPAAFGGRDSGAIRWRFATAIPSHPSPPAGLLSPPIDRMTAAGFSIGWRSDGRRSSSSSSRSRSRKLALFAFAAGMGLWTWDSPEEDCFAWLLLGLEAAIRRWLTTCCWGFGRGQLGRRKWQCQQCGNGQEQQERQCGKQAGGKELARTGRSWNGMILNGEGMRRICGDRCWLAGRGFARPFRDSFPRTVGENWEERVRDDDYELMSEVEWMMVELG